MQMGGFRGQKPVGYFDSGIVGQQPDADVGYTGYTGYRRTSNINTKHWPTADTLALAFFGHSKLARLTVNNLT